MELYRGNSGPPLICFIKKNNLIQVEWMWADMLTIANSVNLFQRRTLFTDKGNRQLPLHCLGVCFCEVQNTFSCSPSPLFLHPYVHWNTEILKVKCRVICSYTLYFESCVQVNGARDTCLHVLHQLGESEDMELA